MGEQSCDQFLPCGCMCGGVRGEKEHLPCLKHDFETDIGEDYCPICYVEGLNEAPCIKLQCNHIAHFQCTKDKIKNKWNGARITFSFKACPTCNKPMQHPFLKDLLAPMNEIERIVHLKCHERLKYEGREKDPQIVNKSGSFYKDPLGFALKNYLFYMCYQCKKPYFAGGYQCQEADQAYDPKEMICPGCQPSSVEDCSVHGTDWLAFKCRYCCS